MASEVEETVCAGVTVTRRYLTVGTQVAEVVCIRVHLPHGETRELWLDAEDMEQVARYWLNRHRQEGGGDGG